LELSLPHYNIVKCDPVRIVDEYKDSPALVINPSAVPAACWERIPVRKHEAGMPMLLLSHAPAEDLRADLIELSHTVDLTGNTDLKLRTAVKLLDLAARPCWDCSRSAIMDDTLQTTVWNDGWYLLDIETSGTDPIAHDIIAVKIAYMSNYQIEWEHATLVRPMRPIPPNIERLTGITNEQLKDAEPLSEVVRGLNDLKYPLAPFLFTQERYIVEFLSIAYRQCWKRFTHEYLSVDALAARLFGYTLQKSPEKLLHDIGWECRGNRLLKDESLAVLYDLSMAVFCGLRENYDVRAPGDFDKLYGEGMVE